MSSNTCYITTSSKVRTSHPKNESIISYQLIRLKSQLESTYSKIKNITMIQPKPKTVFSTVSSLPLLKISSNNLTHSNKTFIPYPTPHQNSKQSLQQSQYHQFLTQVCYQVVSNPRFEDLRAAFSLAFQTRTLSILVRKCNEIDPRLLRTLQAFHRLRIMRRAGKSRI